MIRKIPLRGRDGATRAYAVVDAEDFDALMRWRWSYDADRHYAVRGETRVVGGTKVQRSFLMHRQIMGFAHGDRRQVDHRNGDGLDNRRQNLRPATPGLNGQNRQPRSSPRGVCFHKQSGRWMAYCKIAGKRHYLGLHDTEAKAARAAAEFRAANMPYSQEAA